VKEERKEGTKVSGKVWMPIIEGNEEKAFSSFHISGKGQ